MQEPVGAGQEDIEDLVVDDPLELLGDGGKQRVLVKHGADLPNDGQEVGQDLSGQRRRRLQGVRLTQDPPS